MVEPSIVEYVYIWPRFGDWFGPSYTAYNDQYYLGMKLYVGSVECPPNKLYNATYVRNIIIPSLQPMIFTCPPGTSNSQCVRILEGTQINHYLSKVNNHYMISYKT